MRRGGRSGEALVVIGVLTVFLCALLVRLGSTPGPWFDEGWAMSLSRNWIQYGHYGQMRSGQPISGDMLNIGLPTIASIALSFKLFGVGYAQGRLPSVLFSAGSLIVTFYLTRRLYGTRVALAWVLGFSFLAPNFWVHPLVVGRWALGEMAATFFLVAGYLALSGSWPAPASARFSWRSAFLPAIAGVLFGLAAATKIQVLPFMLVALLLPAFLALVSPRREFFRSFAAAAVLFVLSFALVRLLQNALQSSHVHEFSTRDLLETTGLVVSSRARLIATGSFILIAMPTTLTHLLGFRRARIAWPDVDRLDSRFAVGLSMGIFVVSWLAWYVLLSIGWSRYLFIPIYLTGPAFVALLARLTNGFRWRETLVPLFVRGAPADSVPPDSLAGPTLSTAPRQPTHRPVKGRARGRALLVAGLLVATAVPSVATIGYLYSSDDPSAAATAAYINQRAGPAGRVETYEMELFVLLDMPYHYPEDQVLLDLIRRVNMGQDVPLTYNPLEYNPEFLIVGNQARGLHLYDAVLNTGAFRLVRTIGDYQVYQRVVAAP